MNRIERNRVRTMMEAPQQMSASDKEFVETVKDDLTASAVEILLPTKAPAKKKAAKKTSKKSKK